MSPESRHPPRRKETKAGKANRPIPFRRGGRVTDAGNEDARSLEQDLELLARLRRQIDQVPDIDAARIVELHDRIMRGEYRIDSQKLADNLADFEADLDR